jgi:hypothetical protein
MTTKKTTRPKSKNDETLVVVLREARRKLSATEREYDEAKLESDSQGLAETQMSSVHEKLEAAREAVNDARAAIEAATDPISSP